MSRTRPLSVRPLTDAERQALQDSLRSPDAFVLRRAGIVLASAAGARCGPIARRLGFTTQEVREVIHAFNARGLDVLRPASYPPGVVGSAREGPQAHALDALRHQSPRPCGHDTRPWPLEVAADVADEQGVTAPRVGGVTMRMTAASMGVRWLRANVWIISPDTEYARQQAGRDRLIRLAQRHPDWLLGCADEGWPSRLAHPNPRGSVTSWRATSLRQDHSQTLPDRHTGQDDDHALRLIEQTVARDDSEPEAQAQRVRRDALPRPPLRLRRRIIAALVAAVVPLLLAAVTGHVLTTPAHKPAVPPPISSHRTVPSSPALPATGWVFALVVAALLILLVEKQRVVGIPGGRAKTLSRSLTIAILPLLGALAFNVLVEVAASVSHGS